MKIEKNKRLTWYSRQHDAMSQAITPPLLLLLCQKKEKTRGSRCRCGGSVDVCSLTVNNYWVQIKIKTKNNIPELETQMCLEPVFVPARVMVVVVAVCCHCSRSVVNKQLVEKKEVKIEKITYQRAHISSPCHPLPCPVLHPSFAS